ncbi:hypothetical protein [Flammeovirga sp. EKP202]|uniref:hypothetical protein n=1 Tax=Flammeovirga sp. EKP202 TaxID=2770592 RepID=UPI00165F6291|nr:hypothetical protein [Flammeovirga sp. EKP202]MBD0404965.1 hypothetical protein [Flammeovirga sp. EKP202]
MRKSLLYFICLLFMSSAANAQLIPVEIDLSRKNPTYPFLPKDMPSVINDLDQIKLSSPVSVLTENEDYIYGTIKFIQGGTNNLITVIHVKDQLSGDKVKLKLEDIKSIILTGEKTISLEQLSDQHKSLNYVGDKDISGVKKLGFAQNQVTYFEKVKIKKGKKEKEVLLQAVNYECMGCNYVTLYFDPQSKSTQVKVNLDIKEQGYRYKGAVMEFVPDAYYVKNNGTDEVIHISQKSYKQSNGEYALSIYEDATLVSNLKKGNEASVNKYSEQNWAFFLLNTINYNNQLNLPVESK